MTQLEDFIQNNMTAIISLVIGGYAAILSTINLIIKINENRPKAKVKFSGAFVGVGDNLEDYNVLSICNTGNREIHLSGYYYSISNRNVNLYDRGLRGRFYSPRDAVFPHMLIPGKQFEVYAPIESLRNALFTNGIRGKAKIRGCFKDETGVVYKSNAMKIFVGQIKRQV